MSDLAGLKVLVIEDEGAVALLIEDMLLDLGCEIAASAADIDRACELARTVAVDFALVDLNLSGASALPVAHILKERDIPFVFSTGYGVAGATKEFEFSPLLAKPFLFRDLRDKVLLALSRHRQSPAGDPARV